MPRVDSGLRDKYITMKDVVHFCHIKSPKRNVMCVLGKKYPITEEEFQKEFGEAQPELKFDKSKAGKRMKFEIPATWETMVSEKGNVKEVWT